MNMFTTIPVEKRKKSKFNLSHRVRGTCNFGLLIPVLCKDVLPGDSWDQDSALMGRVTPLTSPMMHEVDVKLYSFFVPYRLVWTEFKEYITRGRLGQDSPVHPYVKIGTENAFYFDPGTLADYLGIQSKLDENGVVPVPVTNETNVSVLQMRAYQEICNEYFNNDNVNAPATFSKGSGNMDAELAVLSSIRTRQWEADRYVSALPFAQRGDTVIMPVDIEYTYKPVTDVYVGGVPSSTDGVLGTRASSPGEVRGDLVDFTAGTGEEVRFENIEDIEGTSLDINEFREALALQKWLENNAVGGNKYIDQLLIRWGVRSSDARLQRPEFLGGASAPLVISEVLSTAQFENETEILPQGNMAGHGITVGSGNGFRRFFEEHGVVMTLMCVVPRTAYMQGIAKMFSRLDALEWANPEFAHLGEEQILRAELYYDTEAAAGDDLVPFGYTPRFSDYKYSPSTVHGEMRTSLKHWTMAREFENTPLLNQAFVSCTPTTRVFAVEDPDIHHFYYSISHRISVVRGLPYYGRPGKMTI